MITGLPTSPMYTKVFEKTIGDMGGSVDVCVFCWPVQGEH